MVWTITAPWAPAVSQMLHATYQQHCLCNLAFIVRVKMALSPAPSFSGKPAGVAQHVQRERDAL